MRALEPASQPLCQELISKMAAHEAGMLLKKAWRERWTVEIWTHQVSKKMGSIEVKNLKDFRKSLTGNNVVYCINEMVLYQAIGIHHMIIIIWNNSRIPRQTSFQE